MKQEANKLTVFLCTPTTLLALASAFGIVLMVLLTGCDHQGKRPVIPDELKERACKCFSGEGHELVDYLCDREGGA